MNEPPPDQKDQWPVTKYNINQTFVDWDTAPLPDPYAFFRGDSRGPSYDHLDAEISVALIGLSRSGKRSFLRRLGWTEPKHHSFCSPSTLDNLVVRGTVQDPSGVNPSVTIEICSWDMDRYEEQRTYQFWRHNFRRVHAVIWMVDASDPDHLDGVGDGNPHRIHQQSRAEFDEMIRDDSIRGKPILVLCNKMDRPGAIHLAGCHWRMGLPFPVLNDGWSNSAITRDQLLPIIHDCFSAVISASPLRVLIAEYALGSVEDLQSGFVRCEPMVSVPPDSESGVNAKSTGKPSAMSDPLRAVYSLVPAVYLRYGLKYPPPKRSTCTLM